MKRRVVIIAALVVVIAAGYLLWRRIAGASPEEPVQEAAIRRGDIRLTVAATGRVVANLDVEIKCKASGEVARLPFDVSSPVKKGDLLLELDPVDQQRILKQADVALAASTARLAMARANLLVAERTLAADRQRAEAALHPAEVAAADARAKADRMKELLAANLASPEECDTVATSAAARAAELTNARIRLDEMKTQEMALELRRQEVKLAEAQLEADRVTFSVAQDRLADTRVTAPLDGVVSARYVQTGQIISSAVSNVGGGTTVMMLSDLAQIFVVASVDECDIGQVRLGAPATITADAFPGKVFSGKVTRIATRGVNVSNVVTFEVKIEVTGEHKALLKPEMTANVEILGDERNGVLMMPVEALFRKGGKPFVAVRAFGGRATDRPVEVGLSDGNHTEVLSGLNEGEVVLVRRLGDSRWTSGAAQAAGPFHQRGAPPGRGGRR